MSASGYFLAMRIKTDVSKFTDAGYVAITYPGSASSEIYLKRDFGDGYKDIILNITEDKPNITISIDYDGAATSYEETIYSLDITGLTREDKSKSTGSVKAVSVYGIASSSPAITMGDGSEINVSYDVIAYSSAVQLPLQQDKTEGYYVALQLNVPEAVSDTVMLAETIVPASGEDFYFVLSEDKSYVQFAMRADTVIGSTKEFTIKWGGDKASAYVQTLKISVPEDCVLVNECAVLPSSIAFNGLVSTMYVGQSQNVSVTFKKKYEQDAIQVFYTSGNSNVVKIDRVTGVIEAVGVGTAEIKVTAVDTAGNILQKTAKITVKALTAPASVKVSNIKDTSVSVSWKANTTAQYVEVYAIPYSALSELKSTAWKGAVEDAMQSVGMSSKMLSSLDEDKDAKDSLLKNLAEALGEGSYAAEYAASDKTSLEITGLQANTDYVFYVRNISETVASETFFAGVMSSKVTTKSVIFDSIKIVVEGADNSIETVTENGTTVYIIEEAQREVPLTISYIFIKDGKEMTETPEFKSPKFNSSNTNIVKLTAIKGDSTRVTLSYGAQVGDVRIYVTGKDSSDTASTSEEIIIRVIKKPTKLTKKTTTLTIGQSISIKELIGTDLKGNMEGMDLSGLNFATALEKIRESGYFEVSYPSGEEDAENAFITAAKLIDGKSGKSVNIPFSMNDSASSVDATIKINDMAAPTISKVTVKDISAVVQFKPSSAVTEVTGDRYYTLILTDTVTKEEWEVAENTEGPFTCVFTPGTVWTCEISGLSSNKAYQAVIVAHYDADDIQSINFKKSSAKKFTTSKPLLTSGGSIEVRYINLENLRKAPDSEGELIDYNDASGINLENNGTYVFMAQVSNLARTLETDKLKWAISSGDKKSASIKASSATFEMQLTTTKIGTFTVTATSTVTKEVVATFVVNVIPYQSGGTANPLDNTVPNQVAYLPETETELLFKIKREDAA